MEYAFAVSAPTAEGEVTLAAPEYVEGHLDWYAFNVGALTGQKTAPQSITRTAIPAPVTYQGMPASRYWEFEDREMDFGALEADPEDLARRLLVEFALVYGNDWFVIPVEVSVGSVCRIRSLVVTDTFGQRTLIPPASQVDGTHSSWQMFRLALPPAPRSVCTSQRSSCCRQCWPPVCRARL